MKRRFLAQAATGLAVVVLPSLAARPALRGAYPPVSAREAYPRRVDRNTVVEGGIDNGPSLRVRGSVTRVQPPPAG
jgi:hypothetical protein